MVAKMKDEGIEMAVERIQECIVSVDKSHAAGVITQAHAIGSMTF